MSLYLRKDLEREAERLGLPWTQETSDQDLEKLVNSRKEGKVASTDTPNCFGLMWEAVGQSVCMSCAVRVECLHKFAMEKIPTLQQEQKTVENMAKSLGVMEEAILVAIDYAQEHGVLAKPEGKAKVKRAPVAKPPALVTEPVLAPVAPAPVPPPFVAQGVSDIPAPPMPMSSSGVPPPPAPVFVGQMNLIPELPASVAGPVDVPGRQDGAGAAAFRGRRYWRDLR